MSSTPSLRGRPAVDARLVAPESGYEVLDGKLVEVPPADEPHGTRHSKVTALLEASVGEDYDVAVDMLTRTSKTNDFAPDASVFPRARDPRTGGRRLEELALEVLSTQRLGDAEDKARKLAQRGVRRVFAIDIPHERVFEWAVDADTWQLLPDAGVIEDRCLAVPIPVAALVKATRADDAVARALLAKRNPVLAAAIVESHEEGRTQGETEGRRRGREEGLRQGREEGQEQGRKQGELVRARAALLALAEARTVVLTAVQRRRIDDCCDIEQLEAWLRRLATADRADVVLGPGDGDESPTS